MAGRSSSLWLAGLLGLVVIGFVGLSLGFGPALLGWGGGWDGGRDGALDRERPEASGSPGGTPIGSPPPPSARATSSPTTSSPATPDATPTAPSESVRRPLLGPRRLDRAVVVGLVDAFRRRTGAPGVSVAVRWPDGTTWAVTSGLADLRTERPVTPATPFAIASVTKTFTAALVLRLVGEGRIGLDDPIGRWLPELGLPSGITIRMLLDHTSGLGDPFLEAAVDRQLLADRSAVWTADRFLAALPKPSFAPGTGWSYSNANYVVLGLLVERVTGRPYGALLRSTFFEPLGLTSAVVQPDRPGPVPAAHAYRLVKSSGGLRRTDLTDGSSSVPFTSVVTAAGAAGNVAMSATDLARWGSALYGGGLLGSELLAEMIDDAARTAPFRPRIPYGLGVQVVEIAGQPTYGHSGRFLGARAALRYLPRSGITIAVLTNQSRSDIGPLVADLIRAILPPPEACARCA